MLPTIGPLELVIILVIALVIFGPKRLPDVSRSVGNGIRDFKSAITGADPRDDLKSTIARADPRGERKPEERE